MDFPAARKDLLMEAGLSCLMDGFTVRVQAVGGEGALPALLLPFFIFRWTAESHYQQQCQGFEDFWPNYLFALWVAVKSTCCQGGLAIVPAVQGWEEKASWKGLCGGFVSDGAGWLGLHARSPSVQVLQDSLQDLDGVNEVQVRSYLALDSIRGCANAFFG